MPCHQPLNYLFLVTIKYWPTTESCYSLTSKGGPYLRTFLIIKLSWIAAKNWMFTQLCYRSSNTTHMKNQKLSNMTTLSPIHECFFHIPMWHLLFTSIDKEPLLYKCSFICEIWISVHVGSTLESIWVKRYCFIGVLV